MADEKPLYDQDFLAWSEQQAEALRLAARQRSNQLLDWENLAEEIEGLGISQKSALGSQIRRIIHHLLKLEYSHASEPRRGWEDSIADARIEIEDLLERSPSLAQEVSREIEKQTKRSAKLAIRDLERRSELDPATTARMRARAYTEEQVLGDWFPDERRE
jgi:uncharacterized membrane-anchored protein YjiN (DUF445 family)